LQGGLDSFITEEERQRAADSARRAEEERRRAAEAARRAEMLQAGLELLRARLAAPKPPPATE
jgi:hypothetical protein